MEKGRKAWFKIKKTVGLNNPFDVFVALQWTPNISLINLMCRCSNGSLSLKQWSTPQISQPYTIMGTTKVSITVNG
jgi:hypothetical protein